MRSLTIRPAALLPSKRRGSALIATLIVLALVAFSVAAMLHNVSQLSRATQDKIAWEEDYHVAMSGIQMAKAWLIKANLAAAHLPSADATKFIGMTSGSIALCKHVKTNRDNTALLNSMTATDIANYYSTFMTVAGTDIYGGRKVLWEYKGPGNNGKAIVFQNDAASTPTGSIFGASDNVRSYVSSIRFTTPFRSDGTSPGGDKFQKDDLRQVSIIMEATGITEGAGRTKSRTIRQKLLVVPGEDVSTGQNAPPLSPGSAIVAGNSLTISGSSHMDVNWGPVQVKGDADLLDIEPMTYDNALKRIRLNLSNNPVKWHGAGFTNSAAGVGLDKWMKWQVSGLLYKKQGSSRSEIIPRWNPNTNQFVDAPNNGSVTATTQVVADIFSQINLVVPATAQTNVFQGNLPLFTWAGVRLPSGYWKQGDTIPILESEAQSNGLIGTKNGSNQYTVGQGALVQRAPYVATAVDNFMNNDMNYTTWKAFAQAKNLYAKPGSGGFVNASNIPLYVKPTDKTLVAIPTGQPIPSGHIRFTELQQVSMRDLANAAGGYTLDIPDRILFIDTAQGTANGTPTNISLGSNDAFFWKGLFYLQGNLTLGGSGNAPTVNMKNPDQYAQYLSNPTLYKTNGFMIPRTICDGILYASGTVDRTGNSAVYGTVVAKGGMGSGGGPDIYYNSRNKMGLFQEKIVSPNNELAGLISGPIAEIKN